MNKRELARNLLIAAAALGFWHWVMTEDAKRLCSNDATAYEECSE